MLIEFSCKNNRSFQEQQTLSMVKSTGLNSTKDRHLDKTNTFQPNAPSTPALLRTAALYGANASGKSNLIKAMQTMRKIVLLDSQSSGDTLPVEPFLFDSITRQEPTEFEVIFVANHVRYQYGFAATTERVVEEWLYSFPKGRERHLLGRVYDEEKEQYQWHINASLSGKKATWKETTRANELFLSNAVRLNSKELEIIVQWFNNDLISVTEDEKRTKYFNKNATALFCMSDELKPMVLNLMKMVDASVLDIHVYIDGQLQDGKHIAKKDHLKQSLSYFYLSEQTDVRFVYKANDSIVELDFEQLSEGTCKVFQLVFYWLLALSSGKVVIIDEIHNHLHPLLVRFLIDLFHSKSNIANGQLVFTTHETSVLNQQLFRRDQIWFIEKNKAQQSILYPLTDFNVRDRDNLERDYLEGRYGALPYLKQISLAMGQPIDG